MLGKLLLALFAVDAAAGCRVSDWTIQLCWTARNTALVYRDVYLPDVRECMRECCKEPNYCKGAYWHIKTNLCQLLNRDWCTGYTDGWYWELKTTQKTDVYVVHKGCDYWRR